ncbi:Nif3-like dinuclear metal center hexameric protein [Ectothiorhodospira variabilis]|uniref:Nif3-like dinuclear metal center hexameric protein n=1 Tax=Ectothiorhodospira variabilis TaxID=505694 RepID=UPI001EFBA9B5|nr:Nif3-like dinuclear metal center hexameric protein [Ectothiorhodospira variabilis]MCG5493419.1 Nif3-like dinuclear metal center hexameric protein [Ectothiorhodospira variabilis]MCG5502748.1 Nif3-like dinuclear metal center hexameric protein [Ectothiorhodospira variabilis]MCG5505486.1 Nif3-like dinuclear metal center hexameric protein [Ectothiorhodospira variabilis]
MVAIQDLVSHVDDLLNVSAFTDYSPNGLQVQGRPHVGRLVTGVTASRALIEAAIQHGADALLVHHGYFWKGEDARVTGMKRERLRLLLAHDINLLAYHLPLDAHPELGNNAQLARLLEFQVEGLMRPDGVGNFGRPLQVLSGQELKDRIARRLQREPLWIASGPESIQRVGWCTGGAQGMIEQAVALGLDAFITGEVSEQTVHVAREEGIHFFAAGHHATERYGPKALGEYLAQTLALSHEFIDIDNPI